MPVASRAAPTQPKGAEIRQLWVGRVGAACLRALLVLQALVPLVLNIAAHRATMALAGGSQGERRLAMHRTLLPLRRRVSCLQALASGQDMPGSSGEACFCESVWLLVAQVESLTRSYHAHTA